MNIKDASNINFQKRFRVGRIIEKYKDGITKDDIINIANLDINDPNIDFTKVHQKMIDQKIIGYLSNVDLQPNGTFSFTITWEDNTKTTLSWYDDIKELEKLLFYEKFVKLDAKNIINYITQYAIRKPLNRQVALSYRKELIPKKKKQIITKRMKERTRQAKHERRALRKAQLNNNGTENV